MYILCGEKESINLDPLFQLPKIISIKPFVGASTLSLKMDLSSYFLGICYQNSFPSLKVHSIEEIPEFTYLAIFKSAQDYLFFSCLSHKDLNTHLSKGLTLKLTSGTSREANHVRSALIILKAKELHAGIAELMRICLKETGQLGKPSIEKPPFPDFLKKMGWQSISSFDSPISHQKVIRSVKELKAKDIQIGYVLIEDGWQQLASSPISNPCLMNFSADSSRFPYGLQGLVSQLAELGVMNVGVTHSIMGCKEGGIHAPLAARYEFPPDASGRFFPGYDLGKTFQFFYDYYASLKQQGVKFVKVIDQESPSEYCRKGMDCTRLYKHLQTAIQAASSLHFACPHLNGDCLSAENLYYWNCSSIASCKKRL